MRFSFSPFTARVAATVLAGLRVATAVAVAAGVATALTASEKALRLQDRWALHRDIENECGDGPPAADGGEDIETRCVLGWLPDEDVVAQMKRIADEYNDKFPRGDAASG